VLSTEEVGRLLEAAPGPGLKYKAALSVAYGAGLRAAEVAALKVSDIDSKRMLIRVEQGKGRKDRHAMLPPQLLDVLRAWWRQCRSQGWLFPGRDPFLPITTRRLPAASTPYQGSGVGARKCQPCPCIGARSINGRSPQHSGLKKFKPRSWSFVRALDPVAQIRLFGKLKLMDCANLRPGGKPRRAFV